MPPRSTCTVERCVTGYGAWLNILTSLACVAERSRASRSACYVKRAREDSGRAKIGMRAKREEEGEREGLSPQFARPESSVARDT